MSALRIGTRRSDLAKWQAEMVAARIEELPGAPKVDLVFIKTEGDQITDVPLHAVDGKAFFTKEIEQALLDARVDLAVHSLKDLATELPEGLSVGAVLEREDPRDVLVSKDGLAFDELPAGAVVGTSSLRRRALVSRRRSDLRIADLRGNVPTRLRKVQAGEYDAIVLAAAGLKRLGLAEHITEFFPTDSVLPAVSQGAVAVEVRKGDEGTLEWVRPLNHENTQHATTAERALLRELEGGCQVPVGALATVTDGVLTLSAVVSALSGDPALEGARSGPAHEAAIIGKTLAVDLLEQGAATILAAIRTGGAEGPR